MTDSNYLFECFEIFPFPVEPNWVLGGFKGWFERDRQLKKSLDSLNLYSSRFSSFIHSVDELIDNLQEKMSGKRTL